MSESEMFCVSLLLCIICAFFIEIAREVRQNKKTKSTTEYKKGYKDGYEKGDSAVYKRMKKFIGTCGGKSPEINYAKGYIWGYADANRVRERADKLAMCKTEKEWITKHICEEVKE